MARVLARGAWETRADEIVFNARVAAAEKSNPIRSFQNTPREEGEISAGLTWIGDRVSLDLVATYVSDPADGKEYRADGSQVSVALGNATLTAGVLDRWWGPSWDSSLVLSATSPEAGSATEEIEVTYGGDALEIGFNSKYLLDIAQQIESESAQFVLADAASPTIVQDVEDASALYVLMPMRV